MEKENLPTAIETLTKHLINEDKVSFANNIDEGDWIDGDGAFSACINAIEKYKDLHTAPLQTRIEELETWKESMTKVIYEVDLQECGKLLKVGLGQDIAGNIVPKIKELKEENEKAFKELYRLTDLAFKYQQALEVIARNPQWLSKNLVREAKEALKAKES